MIFLVRHIILVQDILAQLDFFQKTARRIMVIRGVTTELALCLLITLLMAKLSYANDRLLLNATSSKSFSSSKSSSFPKYSPSCNSAFYNSHSVSKQSSIIKQCSASKKLQDAFKKLQKPSNQSKVLLEYISAFPKTAAQFNQFFSNKDDSPLYDGSQYILQLEYFVEYHPREIIQVLLSLSSELTLSTSASHYLQLILMKICINYSAIFVESFDMLSASKQQSVINFMASGENGPGVGYDTLITILLKSNNKNLANRLRSVLAEKNRKH